MISIAIAFIVGLVLGRYLAISDNRQDNDTNERKQVYEQCLKFLIRCKEEKAVYGDYLEHKAFKWIRLTGLCSMLKMMKNTSVFESIYDFPEILSQRPEDKDVHKHWWNTVPYDYDNRIKALKQAIELCDKG